MTSSNIRPIFGPAPTFGMSDVQKAQLAEAASQAARLAAVPVPPGSPDGATKPSVANFQAHFLTRRPTALNFGSTTPQALGAPAPAGTENYLHNNVVTGYEHLTTPELWREYVAKAKEAPASLSTHFTFTDPNVVNAMLIAADIKKDDHVLEPSAGTGSIALPAALASNNVEALENFPLLQELLKRGAISPKRDTLQADLVTRLQTEQPRFTLLQHDDFLQLAIPDDPNKQYDKIILSPPFMGHELDHIKKAYDMLKPGGSLVTILPGYDFTMSKDQLPGFSLRDSNGKERTFKQYLNFREWVEAHRDQDSATYIDDKGCPTSKKKSVRKIPFMKYEAGPGGEVVEKPLTLNAVLLRITKPPVAIPLDLDKARPDEKPAEAPLKVVTAVLEDRGNVVDLPVVGNVDEKLVVNS